MFRLVFMLESIYRDGILGDQDGQGSIEYMILAVAAVAGRPEQRMAFLNRDYAGGGEKRRAPRLRK